MIPSNTLEEKAAFDRFSDQMAKMMIKHGPSVLKLCIYLRCAIVNTQCVFIMIIKKRPKMYFKDKIVELRESTGMNRKEFCEYFHIPYRTVTEWERDNRHAPEYVLRLLEYYIRMEGLMKDKKEEDK